MGRGGGRISHHHHQSLFIREIVSFYDLHLHFLRFTFFTYVTCGLFSFIPTVLHRDFSLITRVLFACSRCVHLYVACAFFRSSSHTVSPLNNPPAFLHAFSLRTPISYTVAHALFVGFLHIGYTRRFLCDPLRVFCA